ncbi:GntR family transcriptional regulator [Sphingobium yanoikuyae]|uniref:GntR family transcriptional regulator n=1 Tax=Sphingobium yanoikuyae TaxID=13690 RepID=A0A430BQ86_SPHYA|nr:GntR family transcriptional regulator [Sphingobium yanoikuyae]RSU54898.1 GntR family transcriptional regulator [Sphingobium yanoikuyae]
MSPEAFTADRIHREIKELIVAGKFTPGLPLTVQSLADDFGTSTSPVRDALNRLVGERLVDMQGGGGFALPGMTRRTAYHLYSFHGDLIRTIVKVMARLDELGPPPAFLLNKTAGGVALAHATAEFFALTAACSPNPEHLDAIVQIGERLAVLRLHEGAIGRQGEELATLWNVTRSGNRNATRVAMWQYHRRRLLRVEDISASATRTA